MELGTGPVETCQWYIVEPCVQGPTKLSPLPSTVTEKCLLKVQQCRVNMQGVMAPVDSLDTVQMK